MMRGGLVGVLLLSVAVGQASAAPRLYFSEYVEGSGTDNKFVEIFNASSETVEFVEQAVSVQVFLGGSTSPSSTIALAGGALAPGDTYVLGAIPSSCGVSCLPPYVDQGTWALTFTGDDAVALVVGGETVDVIGQIGFDPGTEWGTGAASTQDNTLRRKTTIGTGDPNGGDPFDPALEWDGYAIDTTSGLGEHMSGDSDGDGLDDVADNCTSVANPGQEDTDSDRAGDACDADDDGDGSGDAGDNCPLTGNPGQADHDGDAAGDACDPDDDNDGRADGVDPCPSSGPTGPDTDGDGCRDAEDADDDGDGRGDTSDNCPEAANPDQADTDGDGRGDACDDSNDTTSPASATGSAPSSTGTSGTEPSSSTPTTLTDTSTPAATGSPAAARTLRLRWDQRRGRFAGRLAAPEAPSCATAQVVKVWRERSGRDRRIGRIPTAADGRFFLPRRFAPGRYYATVAARPGCMGVTSKRIGLG